MTILRLLRRHPLVKFISGPIPSRAYGFILEDENFDHFARYYLDKFSLHPDKPEQLENRLAGIADLGYILIPTCLANVRIGMPAVRREVVWVIKENGMYGQLLVLCDNASPATMDVQITPEDLHFIREFLNIPPDVAPNWYDVPEDDWPKGGA
ncbi:hypothetical protein PsYK624_102630 [Phanerochaete sordida]|uniref:Uncharacterized protein n=1 Tax=Phanerochaete sordida TaxID=48140 RepID=A0A9P3GI58_9APHY|nr:hypothetical protein PsYK624_102630 [Phanerochaete sordida]